MVAKKIVLALIIAIVMAIPITVAGAPQSKNLESSKADKARSPVGSWIATISAEGIPPFKALLTFTRDGTLLVSQAPIVPLPPPIGRAVFTIGQGEWTKIKNGEFAFKFVALIHDENATFLGTSVVSGSIHFIEIMDAVSGSATAADLDADGNVLFSFDVSLKAVRIRVGP